MLCVCRIGSMETTKKWKRHVEKNDAAALNSATVHPYYLVAVLPCSYANPINRHTHPPPGNGINARFLHDFCVKEIWENAVLWIAQQFSPTWEQKEHTNWACLPDSFLTYRKLLLWYERIFSYSWESQTISQFSPFLSARLTQNHPIKDLKCLKLKIHLERSLG